MSNIVDQLAPNPVTHEHGENGCCPDPRAWELEMMHQVWAAGLHDAANCFQDALEAKAQQNLPRHRRRNGGTVGIDHFREVTEMVTTIEIEVKYEQSVIFQRKNGLANAEKAFLRSRL